MTGEKKGGIFIPSNVKEEAEPDKENPWGDDELGRQKYAKPLTDLVISEKSSPFCIAVDGGWGSGKTFFLKRWCAEFSKQGEAIYFNAWEDDFHADPLTAIIGQLWKEIKSPVLKEICDSVKENWETIVAKTVKTSLHCYAPGLVPDLTSDDLKTVSRKIVGEYLETQQSINELKNLLKELADKTKKETKKPLVLVVDELDRCRPTFSIELLERVKHIVGVPGVVFVFGINQKGLETSIRSAYGEIDAVDYLRKSFHISMTLPQAEASQYCAYLIKEHQISENIEKSKVHQNKPREGLNTDWSYTMIKEMPAMVDYMGLSLRQIEQAVRMWLVALLRIENTSRGSPYHLEGYLAVFILLRIKSRDMYEKFFNENCDPQEVMNYLLDFLRWEEVQGDEYGKRKNCMESIVLACYLFYTGDEYLEIIDEFKQANKAKVAGESPKKYCYVPQKIVEIPHDGTRLNSIRELSDLIKYAGRFKRYPPPSRQMIASFLEWGG